VSTNKQMKVILIEPVLPHYRKDVFSLLSNNENFEMNFLAGSKYQRIKSITPEGSIIADHCTFSFFKHRFYYLKSVLEKLRKNKPDIIICTGVDFHLIHTIVIFLYFRLIKRRKFFWWSHATKGNQGRLGYLVRKWIYRKSSGIMAYNREGRDNLLEMGLSDERIAVVNNSINREDYGFLNYDIVKKEKTGVFTILYSGRITEEKKVDLLIRALGIIKSKGVTEFKCYLVGDGDIDRLKELASEKNLPDNIHFTGSRYGKDNHPIFLGSDLFVCPGGIGLSIVHAMSFGLPVVTTDNLKLQGPESELLVPGENGDTFKDNSASDLADKIIRWKDIIDNSGDRIRQSCIERIKRLEYLPDKQAQKVIDFMMRTNRNR